MVTFLRGCNRAIYRCWRRCDGPAGINYARLTIVTVYLCEVYRLGQRMMGR